jgi:hypothetical protein
MHVGCIGGMHRWDAQVDGIGGMRRAQPHRGECRHEAAHQSYGIAVAR